MHSGWGRVDVEDDRDKEIRSLKRRIKRSEEKNTDLKNELDGLKWEFRDYKKRTEERWYKQENTK